MRRLFAVAILGLPLSAAEPPDKEIGRRLAFLAEGKYQESQAILDSLIRDRTSGAALNDLAAAAMPAGDYELGIAAASAALRQLRNSPLQEEWERAENFLGLARLYRGQYEMALEHFQAALELDQTRGDRQRQAQRWNNVGIVHYYQGRYGDALRAYQSAEEVASAAGQTAWREGLDRLTTANLATLYQKLGQYNRALQCYRRMQAVKGGRLLPREEAQILSNLGSLERRLGDIPKALALYAEAISLYRRDHNADGEIGNLKNIGILLALDRRDYAGAEQRFREAMARAQATGSTRELMQCRLYLGETLFRAGRFEEAKGEWTQAVSLARQMDAVEDLWRAQAGLGRVLAVRNDPLAGRQFEEAAELLESVRGRLRSTSLRSDFLVGRRELFDAWMSWTARSGKAEEVFAIMERARARTLRDRRRRALEATSSEAPARLPELAGEIARLTGGRSRPGGDTEALDRRIYQLEQEYVQLEEAWERESGLQRLAQHVTATELRRQLPPSAGLVSYWVSGDRIHRVALSHNEAHYAALPLDANGRQTLETWPTSLGQSGEWRTGAAAAGRLLWSGMEEGVRSWVVVADGALGMLPFEALENPETKRLVIEDSEVVYLPAASLWHGRTGRVWKMPWSPGALAMAGTGVPLPGDEHWGDLPEAGVEAQRVGELVSARSEVQIGESATRSRLRSGTPWPVIHLATHGLADSQDPARSRLLLGDGYLFQGEVESLSLPWEPLVTLSACETGAGANAGPEGVQSLSQAFLSAGAGAAVASFWRVEDRAAAAFMERWYARLARGQTAGEALREVKLEFLSTGGIAGHPSRWAAYVLQGDGEWQMPRYVRWWEIAVAVAALMLVASVLIQRHRKQFVRR